MGNFFDYCIKDVPIDRTLYERVDHLIKSAVSFGGGGRSTYSKDVVLVYPYTNGLLDISSYHDGGMLVVDDSNERCIMPSMCFSELTTTTTEVITTDKEIITKTVITTITRLE